MDEVRFLASFPPIQSAIKVTGDGNGVRLQLDVPESEMAEAIKLVLWRKKVLRVTIKLESQENSGYDKYDEEETRSETTERPTSQTTGVDGGRLRYRAHSPLGR